ncbi:MAG: GNAT family N-acetyltransferase [Gemmatimonadetes bacterium]|nr:GNAT family N-acetyltransferase [Gemmatimonadota bacterium]
MSAEFDFVPVTAADLPLLLRWISQPHVAEWWDCEPTLEEVREDFLPEPPDPGDCRYVVRHHGQPIGYIQSYIAVDTGGGWWTGFTDPTVRGIDQFIGEPDLVNRGLGTAMVRAFCKRLFSDPTVTAIQLDPDPTNARAIRCYEKAGFLPIGLVETPDGTAYLMRLPRPPA